MFVEFHVIQSFVPSNLNRDDNNYPKSCEFGGVRRARISSQCTKWAVRKSVPFKETIKVTTGTRTRRFMELFKPRLVAAGKSEQEAETAIKAFTTVYAGLDPKNSEFSSVLVFLSDEDIEAMVKAILGNWEVILESVQSTEGKFPKKALQKAPGLKKALADILKQTKGRTSAPGIALFGRMLADNPEFGMDAACQVAHAISTHAVEVEYDYFTAVDDLQEKDEPGAGMINVTSFNSACYYRYACLDWEQLRINLRKQGLAETDVDLARATVDGFMRALVEVVPTGMRNRFAQNNQPNFVLTIVRDGGPAWSLANAFEKPVYAGHEQTGLVGPSVQRLDRYWDALCRAYGDETVRLVSFFALDPDLADQVRCLRSKPENEAQSLKAWREAVLSVLPEESAV